MQAMEQCYLVTILHNDLTIYDFYYVYWYCLEFYTMRSCGVAFERWCTNTCRIFVVLLAAQRMQFWRKEHIRSRCAPAKLTPNKSSRSSPRRWNKTTYKIHLLT